MPDITYSLRESNVVPPESFARVTAAQLAAGYLRENYGFPIVTHDDADHLHLLALEQWSLHGYAPLRDTHSLGDCMPDASPFDGSIFGLTAGRNAAPARPKAKPKAKAKAPKQKGNASAHQQLPGSRTDGPFEITWADQRKDPLYRAVRQRLEAGDQGKMGTLAAKWTFEEGKLWRLAIDAVGEPYRRLVVPSHIRSGLMAHFHYSNHRGHEPLKDQLRCFWWPNMDADCLDFVRTCTVCQQRLSRPLHKVEQAFIPTPSTPFSVIHVDHKGPLPMRRSGSTKYNNILVVTCALTRFTLLIPVESTTAEETLRVLVGRVFCVFGHPAVIVSDNGPAFAANLTAEAAKFFGYRHVHIMPYNAQANGVAEASVKRIKLLLDRHTEGYADWHKSLPWMQHMLNTTTHTSTGVSPYVALFGREPDGIEKLENPALYPTPSDGNEYLKELKPRLTKLHAQLKQASDAIKQARVEEANRRELPRLGTSRFGTIQASTPDQPRYVWLLHGSKEQAEYVRKHGHGLPWKHKYKVLELRPHAARLEVPKDGTVPVIGEWQLLRRMVPAAPDEHTPPADWPHITEAGIRISPANPSLTPGNALGTDDGEPRWDGEDDWYDLEEVPHAERVGPYYKVWLRWENYEPLTWRWHHEIKKEGWSEENMAKVTAAVDAARLRYQTERGRADEAELEDEFDGFPPPATDEGDDGTPRLGRGMRIRSKPDRLISAVLGKKHRDARRSLAAMYHLAAAPLLPPHFS